MVAPSKGVLKREYQFLNPRTILKDWRIILKAVKFVLIVKARFINRPEIYETFITNVMLANRGIITPNEFRNRARVLFDGHVDLIIWLNNFLRHW